MRSHYSDILYSTALQDGGDAYVYVLFEHKSYPDRHVPFQLLRYMVRVWERQREHKEELRPIFPIVVYHGERKWNYPLNFASLVTGLRRSAYEEMRPYVPDYRYCLCDLSQYSDEVIIGTVYLQMALLLLKYASRGEFWEKLPDVGELFVTLLEADRQTALGYFEAMLRYISGVRKDKDDAELREAIEDAIPYGGEMMETILERWAERAFQRGIAQGEERGIQRGLVQGIQQGEERGMQRGLLRGVELGLKLKFGAKGAQLLPEIYDIQDVKMLRAIHEALPEVDTPAELRRIYRQNGDNDTDD